MNNERRRLVKKATKNLNRVISMMEEALDAEHTCMDNIPESLQDTERFIKMENAADKLEMSIDSLVEAQSYAQEAII